MAKETKQTITLDDDELLTLYGSGVAETLGLKCGTQKLTLKGGVKVEPGALGIKVGPKV